MTDSEILERLQNLRDEMDAYKAVSEANIAAIEAKAQETMQAAITLANAALSEAKRANARRDNQATFA